jgi:hypothetical protein
MGNIAGVVQHCTNVTYSSNDGLAKWEEQAFIGLSPSNKFLDAARLIAAWPHLRSTFLTFVQSGRWLQSYYASQQRQMVSFPVQLVPFCLQQSRSQIDISAGEDVATVVSFHSEFKCAAADDYCAGVSTSTKLCPQDSTLRTGTCSYALLLAAVFPLFIDFLQNEEELKNWSMSSSAPASPGQTTTAKIPSVDTKPTALDQCGGDNPQENALREYLKEKFFVADQCDADGQVSLYSVASNKSHQSPSIKSILERTGVEPTKTDCENFVTKQEDLWHLEETLVSAMAQLDFMTLNQRLKQHNRRLDWARDLLHQLESLPIGVAVVNSSTSHPTSEIFLDDLRVVYTNGRFSELSASLLASLTVPSENACNGNFQSGDISIIDSYRKSKTVSGRTSADQSVTVGSQSSSSKTSSKLKLIRDSLFFVAVSSSSTLDDTSVRNSSRSSRRMSAASLSATAVRLSQRISGRLTFNQSQLMPTAAQKQAVVFHSLSKLLSRLPATNKPEKKHSSREKTLSAATKSEVEAASGDERDVLNEAMQELHNALRFRHATIILCSASQTLWIVRPVMNISSNEINKELNISHLMLVQIRLPEKCSVSLTAIPGSNISSSWQPPDNEVATNDACVPDVEKMETIKPSQLLLQSQGEITSFEDSEETENDENVINTNRTIASSQDKTPKSSWQKYSTSSAISSRRNSGNLPYPTGALRKGPGWKMVCCSNEQFLQDIKLAEEVCNVLPPLLLL